MAEKMKAQVFYEAEKMQHGESRPIPQVSDIDVLVRVKNCGVCGSDVSYYYGFSPVGTATGKGPIVLGHEFTGEVVEVGAIAEEHGAFQARRSCRGQSGAALQCLLCLRQRPYQPVHQPLRAGRHGRRRASPNMPLALHRPVQAARQRQLRGRRLHRAVRLRSLRRQEAGHRARAVCGRLWARPHRLDDGADGQVRGRRQGCPDRHARLPAGSGPRSGAPTTCSTQVTPKSPYYAKDLKEPSRM